MTTFRHHLLAASLLACAAFGSSAALAQAAPAAPVTGAADAPVSAPPMPHQRMDPAQRIERMQAYRAKRLAALKEKLQLTPAQEGAWSGFTAATQRPAGAALQRPDRAEFAKLTTPQRLERMQARQTERSARFAQRADATKTFYAALTPEQQKTFDAETLHTGHHGHGARGHHGGHGMGMAAPAKG